MLLGGAMGGYQGAGAVSCMVRQVFMRRAPPRCRRTKDVCPGDLARIGESLGSTQALEFLDPSIPAVDSYYVQRAHCVTCVVVLSWTWLM